MGKNRTFDTFGTLVVLTEARRVELIRSTEAFADNEELRAYWAEANARIAHLPLKDWGVLTDLRAARGRNDEEFERLTNLYRRPFYNRFGRSAVVVRTSVGRMHVTRHTSDDQNLTRIFDNVDEARAWLLGG